MLTVSARNKGSTVVQGVLGKIAQIQQIELWYLMFHPELILRKH